MVNRGKGKVGRTTVSFSSCLHRFDVSCRKYEVGVFTETIKKGHHTLAAMTHPLLSSSIFLETFGLFAAPPSGELWPTETMSARDHDA